MAFLNIRKELPIVSFHIGYDRDRVLQPAFKRLGLEALDGARDRWRCAQELCKRTGNWRIWNLDEALEHFGFERREEDTYHDALHDARLAAQVYMQAMQLPPLKTAEFGFKIEK